MMPTTLDHAGIAALIPHRGPMCLLDRMAACDETRIECVATNHRDDAIRCAAEAACSRARRSSTARRRWRCTARLVAQAAGGRARPGFLASARDVRLACWRLDDLPPAEPDELRVVAERVAADDARILYAFSLRHAGRELASGRVAVVLDAEPVSVS